MLYQSTETTQQVFQDALGLEAEQTTRLTPSIPVPTRRDRMTVLTGVHRLATQEAILIRM